MSKTGKILHILCVLLMPLNVNHEKLFSKFYNREVHKSLVRSLCFWYARQSINIKWRNCVCGPFNVCHGVRQGTVLSPLLFNDSSKLLNNCVTGCITGDTIVGRIQ